MYGRRTASVRALSVAAGSLGLQTGPMALDEDRPAGGTSFDEVVIPHLDAAYRLARWRMGNQQDAEDVVQEASLRALRYFRTFTGGDGRAWFLQIVRNSCSTWRGRRFDTRTDPFDEEQHHSSRRESNPEALLLQTDDAALVARAMQKVPPRFHRLLVLREFDGLSYREVAEVMGIPMGTVMSGLSRARRALREAMDSELKPPRGAGTTCAP